MNIFCIVLYGCTLYFIYYGIKTTQVIVLYFYILTQQMEVASCFKKLFWTCKVHLHICRLN